MKKVIFTILSFCSLVSLGQDFYSEKIPWQAPNSSIYGHVSSRVKFDATTNMFKFVGSGRKDVKSILFSDAGSLIFATGDYGTSGSWPANSFVNNEATVNDYKNAFGKATISKDGYFGLGTLTPSSILDVRKTDGKIKLYSPGANTTATFWSLNDAYSYGFGIGSDNKGHIFQNINGPSSIMTFYQGNVGIGTDLSWDIGKEYKLAVKGKIRAQEIRVELANWGDYVFKQDYKLLSLNDVETYINKEGHLPNVPGAKEIEKDAFSLGELTKIQQVKIEELTLYLIEMKKEIEALKAQINN